MRKHLIYFLGFIFILSSCGPKISTSISKNYTPTDYREDIRIYGLQDVIPEKSEELGIVKIGDTGFSTKCGWDIAIESAKIEARKTGGNAIKIIEHKPPTVMGSSCHRITAKILKVEKFDEIQIFIRVIAFFRYELCIVSSTVLKSSLSIGQIYK
jgi:hypothetical protein